MDLELTMDVAATAPLEAVGAAVRGCAMGNGLSAERATRLQVVVEELCREARIREEVNGEDAVVVKVSFDGSVVRVDVIDRRLPMSPFENRHLPSRRLLGLGFVDQLHIAFNGVQGNHASAEVSLGAHREIIGDEVLGPDAPDASDDEAARIEIRSIRHEDIVGLIRCIYRCYGYTYLDPAMYEARHVRRLIDTGRMHSVVAVVDGEVVGHCALVFERPGDRVPEAGRMIVDPRYRGHHLAERMAEFRNEVAKQIGSPGTYANCVTNHVGSQVTAFRRGAVEVGLLLGDVNDGVSMTGLAMTTKGRKSLLSLYNVTGPVGHRAVSIPEHHGDVVRTIVERLDISREISHHPHRPTVAVSSFSSSASAVSKVGEIRVETIGEDLIARLVEDLETQVLAGVLLSIVDLPASDPACAWAAAELERLAFSFSAYLPEFSPDGDVLRLQRFTDLSLDVEHIACGRVEGEALRDFIVEEWRRVTRKAVLSSEERGRSGV